ncbi:uncharacterized protein PgNI_08239 [Pyricularia grisea]|uniref:DNA/RNA-binding protein Alba-like domain-containing protein n=1 Tax=Pyricularia grisea TaxID=148305 RepID=A0A6P8AX60_PYRGI|nr:uncharacterized protein PgNI_08239 [Pyricularia grisea]TLD06749.1 hypothetical protein PgNI_08239 [Pyricularia grisea]
MATTMAILPSTVPSPAKRKQPPDGPTTISSTSEDAAKNNKKQRTGPSNSHIPSRLPLEPHEAIIAELRPRYDIATFSVISSTSMSKRIDQILTHLGRFHPSDMAILPGAALLHARSRDAAKMVSLTELVRRRIHEEGQKWFQYNRLYEVDVEASEETTVIEETVLHGVSDDLDEDGFEVAATERAAVAPNVFERAVMGRPKTEHALYMSVFLSRVPIPELRAKSFITEQTNSAIINQQQKRNFG